MPNWCENFMTISNPKVFKEKCIKDGKFLFSNIMPMPEHVKVCDRLGIENESFEDALIKEGITKDSLKSEKPLSNTFFTRSVIDYLYVRDWLHSEADRTGVELTNWYEWNCDNYGTKWDLCGDDVNMEELEEAIQNNTEYRFGFDTAWSPPEPVLEKMAELGVEFDWGCEEGGFGIYMEGRSDGKSFDCWDVEPPEDDDDYEDDEQNKE